MTSDIPLEDRLLLYCARIEMDKEVIDRAQDLLKYDFLNWDYIIHNSMLHRVGPLLYVNLRGLSDTSIIPERVIQELEKIYQNNNSRNNLLYDELIKVLEAFNTREIGVILLKGSALAKVVYQDIALRPMADIDILMKKEEISNGKKELMKLGYVSSFDEDRTDWHKEWFGHLSTLVKRDTSFTTYIEIHWAIDRYYHKVGVDALWQNSVPIQIADDLSSLMLSPEDLLQHLCFHAVEHISIEGGSRLIWWCDIAEVLKKYQKEINWEKLISSAKKRNSEKTVYQCLSFVEKYLDASVTPEITNRLKTEDKEDVSPHSMFRTIMKGSLDQQAYAEKYLSFISSIPGIYNKTLYIFKTLFPSNAFIKRRYRIMSFKSLLFYRIFHLCRGLFLGMKVLSHLPYILFKQISDHGLTKGDLM